MNHYESMFQAAVQSLAEISKALGIPDEQAACSNGNDLILERIAELIDSGECRSCVGGKCVTGPECVTLGLDSRKPLTDEEIDLIAADGMRNAAGGIYATRVYEFARAIEAIKDSQLNRETIWADPASDEPQWGPILDELDGLPNDLRPEFAKLDRLIRAEHERTLDRIDAARPPVLIGGIRQLEAERDALRALWKEWLDGMYDNADLLRRVKLAVHGPLRKPGNAGVSASDSAHSSPSDANEGKL